MTKVGRNFAAYAKSDLQTLPLIKHPEEKNIRRTTVYIWFKEGLNELS